MELRVKNGFLTSKHQFLQKKRDEDFFLLFLIYIMSCKHGVMGMGGLGLGSISFFPRKYITCSKQRVTIQFLQALFPFRHVKLFIHIYWGEKFSHLMNY